MTEVKIQFSRDARKFLVRHPSVISQEDAESAVITAVRKLSKGQVSSIDVKRLQGDLHDSFRVRLGNIRIIFSVQYGLVHVASVSEIGFRGGAY